jgi:hypothetical protein
LRHVLKTYHVEHHIWSRRSRNRSRSRIALRLQLQLYQNDAATCGSGSALYEESEPHGSSFPQPMRISNTVLLETLTYRAGAATLCYGSGSTKMIRLRLWEQKMMRLRPKLSSHGFNNAKFKILFILMRLRFQSS